MASANRQTMGEGEMRERLKGNAGMVEACGRMVEHLKANLVDLGQNPLTLGIPLLIDAKSERFTGEFAKKANHLLTREYRAPFVVPKIV